VIEQVVDEYQGEARQLGNLLEGNPPPVVGFIDRAIQQIQGYLEIEAPRSSTEEPTSSMARQADPEQGDSTSDEEREEEETSDGSP
jgi:hypothetical protein